MISYFGRALNISTVLRFGRFVQNHYLLLIPLGICPALIPWYWKHCHSNCFFNWSILALREEKTQLISSVSSSKMFLVLDKNRVVKTEVWQKKSYFCGVKGKPDCKQASILHHTKTSSNMKNTFHGVFFPCCGLSIKAAVIMPLKYNSDTYHFVKFVLLKMEKTF